MHRELIHQAFKKVKKEEALENKTQIAKFLSDFINEDCGEPYGERILRDHYNKAIQNSLEKIELRQFAALSLSHYLGYEDFVDFRNKNTTTTGERNGMNARKAFLKKHKRPFLYSIFFIAVITTIAMTNGNKPRWMVWETDHYFETSFDLKKHELNQLKVFEQDRIDNFKRITPNCSTAFFKQDGTEKLWYGKNKKRELQYFTSIGLHPETGKTLKKITAYMIKTHICETYKK